MKLKTILLLSTILLSFIPLIFVLISKTDAEEKTGEFWLVIAVDSKAGEGCYKKGDLIAFLPAAVEPTLGEKTRWACIKTNTKESELRQYTEAWIENEGDDTENTLSFRKFKFNTDDLNLRKGIDIEPKDFTYLKTNIVEKTQADLDAYEAEGL